MVEIMVYCCILLVFSTFHPKPAKNIGKTQTLGNDNVGIVKSFN